MNMKKIFFTCFVLCFAIINASAQTMSISYKTTSDENAEMHYKVSATYPQVDFGPDALMGVRGIAQDINNSLDAIVKGIVRDFVKQVSEMPEKTVDGAGSSLTITSRGWVSNGTLLSVELTTFNNVAGMAHPMKTITTFNFLDDGQGPLSVSDLFLSNSDFLNYISNYCINNLRTYAQKEGYTNIDDMITGGASPDMKNFTEWTIGNDSLNIIFNPYQVAPYVFGIQTVSIPLTGMINMLDPKGPLSFMFR